MATINNSEANTIISGSGGDDYCNDNNDNGFLFHSNVPPVSSVIP